MSSQRALQRSRMSRQLPEPVDERNKKDKHFNDLLFMESKSLKLEYKEIQSFGQRLVKTLRDTLLTPFGMLIAMKTHSLVDHLPSPVHSGVTIVLRKRNRKRQQGNLSRDRLNTMAAELAVLQCMGERALVQIQR